MTIPENPEPSVLDYIKGKLFPGRNPVVEIPDATTGPDFEKPLVLKTEGTGIGGVRKSNRYFWQLILVLIMFLIGQRLLEPPDQSVIIALVFYAFGIGLFVWNWFHGRFDTDLYIYEDQEESSGLTFRPVFLLISLATALLVMFLFTGNRFNGINMTVWIVSILSLIATFIPAPRWDDIRIRFSTFMKDLVKSGLRIQITQWHVIFLVTLTLICFFRIYRLDKLPIEMISDHAEKLLDVNDVLNGMLSTFFPRNTGREAFQMYLSAAVALVFGTGISFMTLKIGTTLMGIFTAIYMYFLGKETGNRRVAMLAFLLCGIGYWPNVISRIGLRFTLYSAFTAPAMYYFLKGLRRKRLSDLMLSGIFVGIGLQGYSPYRVVPVLFILGMILYLIHAWRTGRGKFAVIGLVVTGLAALVFVLPLLRYIIDQPEMVLYRTLTRAGSIEQPLPGPAWQIFLSNLWKAVIMPFWNNGMIWVHSIPYRPALDIVSASMFMMGILACLLRYVHQKDWRILFLILAVPFLMLPSVFSLAFPDENPCLNRTAGALVPIFIIAAMGMDTFLVNIRKQMENISGTIITSLIAGFLILTSICQNYSLVFDQYDNNYINNSLNTSQIGGVIRNFVNVYGDPDSAYVVGFPYWVDTRLVAMNAGYPTKDYAIWPEGFKDTTVNKRAKLFILNTEDTKALDQLRQLYPDYYESVYNGWVPSKNFIMFLVPPSINSSEEVGTSVP
jgi:hypothetical protein